MDCPQCHKPMDRKRVGDAHVDECTRCRGIWFDSGEIETVKEEFEPELGWMAIAPWQGKARFTAETDPLPCPRCPDHSMTALVESESGVRVHACPACGGSWLRAEDLAAVLAALSREAERMPADEYVRESLRQAGALFTLHGSPISEWHDLRSLLRLLKYRVLSEHPVLASVAQGLTRSLPV